MKLRPRLLAYMVVAVWLASPRPLFAEPRGFSFIDPVGRDDTEPLGRGDLVRMDFQFESSTGDYVIRFFADAANPLRGAFRINVNLFNPDTGTTASDPAYFQDTLNDFNLATPVTQLELSGTDPRLLQWDLGDRVATSGPVPLGLPTGGVTSFFTVVRDLPTFSPFPGDRIANGQFTTISPVPEPSAWALLVGGGIGPLILKLRSRRPARSLKV